MFGEQHRASAHIQQHVVVDAWYFDGAAEDGLRQANAHIGVHVRALAPELTALVHLQWANRTS